MKRSTNSTSKVIWPSKHLRLQDMIERKEYSLLCIVSNYEAGLMQLFLVTAPEYLLQFIWNLKQYVEYSQSIKKQFSVAWSLWGISTISLDRQTKLF